MCKLSNYQSITLGYKKIVKKEKFVHVISIELGPFCTAESNDDIRFYTKLILKNPIFWLNWLHFRDITSWFSSIFFAQKRF